MDYSKLTDFAINAAVGAATGEARNSEPLLKLVIRNSTGRRYDPCNNPADAWPIISANKISLHAPRYKEGWMADFTGSDDDVNDGFNVDYFESHNANPLRAAMIVFLMMQGDE
ncbi:hypothetical protein CI789_02630 [Erwinia persicina]|nr:hypothetical protein CI789_02630 [Erwinia persicina]